MDENEAISEIIGVILLIGIIVATFGILAAIYLPTIKPNPVPQVKLSMACSNGIHDFNNIEYPCTKGSFQCNPPDIPFDNKSCENDCRLRDYSQNFNYDPANLERDILRCLVNCHNTTCSDLADCDFIYICHNGGDTLEVNNLEIIVNNQPIDKSYWKMKKPSINDVFTSIILDSSFSIGSTIRLENIPNPVDRVMIMYSLPSGGEVTLALNQFGTDINI